jgi:hypothetical protein
MNTIKSTRLQFFGSTVKLRLLIAILQYSNTFAALEEVWSLERSYREFPFYQRRGKYDSADDAFCATATRGETADSESVAMRTRSEGFPTE